MRYIALLPLTIFFIGCQENEAPSNDSGLTWPYQNLSGKILKCESHFPMQPGRLLMGSLMVPSLQPTCQLL